MTARHEPPAALARGATACYSKFAVFLPKGL
jgi:hypothetical protein